MSPNGGHIVISVSVRLFFLLLVRPSVRIICCVRFSSKTTRPISPILIPIYRGNNVDLQRILYITFTPPWPQVKVKKYFNFVNLDAWWVVVCVRFSSETTRAISQCWYQSTEGTMWICNVYFILTFTPPWLQVNQGYELLQFWEFRCLTGSSLCSLLLRNYSTHFSNADTNLQREQCRFAMCTSFWPSPLHDCRSRLRINSIWGI